MTNVDFSKESKNYDKLYRVPMWVVVDDSYRNATALRLALEDAKSRHIIWPTTVLGEVVDKLKTVGYEKFFKDYPRPLSDMIMMKLLIETTSKTLNPRCKDLTLTDVYFPYSNAWVNNHNDYAAQLDNLLENQDDILLSFIFDTKNSGTKVYWSDHNVNNNVVQKLSTSQLYISDSNYRHSSVNSIMEDIQKIIQKKVQ